ncbi:MAG: MurR/RpiR family transcriptional regulator [Actinomycetota bacterium]|nr:MurR/RpiR family transcriptional regulator [Actinomycetota bacterium]
MQPTRVSDLIAAVGDRLTPTERRIAEAVLAEPTLLAFGNVSDLADQVGTSRPSIVRFANKLSFDGYTELQSHVRRGLSQQISRPSERIRHLDPSLGPTREALEGSIDSVFRAIEDDRLSSLGDPLVRAREIWIVSGETSRAAAHALHSGLTMIRPGVHLVEDHSVGRDLSSAGAGDAAVIFDFFRYRRLSVSAARLLADQGVEVVAITDGPLSPLVPHASAWCELEVPAVGPFDSSVSAVAMAELLVAHVAEQLQDDARDRIDRTEELWAATETFYPDE